VTRHHLIWMATIGIHLAASCPLPPMTNSPTLSRLGNHRIQIKGGRSRSPIDFFNLKCLFAVFVDYCWLPRMMPVRLSRRTQAHSVDDLAAHGVDWEATDQSEQGLRLWDQRGRSNRRAAVRPHRFRVLWRILARREAYGLGLLCL
jgi:hypothetical protein